MGRKSDPESFVFMVLFVIGLYVFLWYAAISMAKTAHNSLHPEQGKKKVVRAIFASMGSAISFLTVLCPFIFLISYLVSNSNSHV